MAPRTLAVDFGTSNTAAACLDAGTIRRLPIEQGAETLPTAVFFPTEGGTMAIGQAAQRALIGGEEGRYMRALKSVLGTTLFHESRLIGGKRRSLAEIVTAFLVTLKSRAEAEAGVRFDHVLSGRPVHFHSADPDRDAQAEIDLRACYAAAGFDGIRFLYEPEAAAFATHTAGSAGGIGLIVDIGGGTSDFTVFEAASPRPRILASHGIRLGGTDFDHAVSLGHVMPHLGYGGQLRRSLGDGLLPVPNAIFTELATWAKIPFVYTPETRRAVADMRRHAVDPAALARLDRVVTDQLGHELAFAAETGKIAANGRPDPTSIDMGCVDRGLTARIDPSSLHEAMAGFAPRLTAAMAETLRMAGVAPHKVGSVIFVGGASAMTFIADGATALCPDAALIRSDAFTAIIDGLALATGHEG